MPKLDIIHHSVKNALIKDGWVITDDPYIIQYRKTKLYADLGVERPIAVERSGDKLVVEIKSFIGSSKIQDLKEALGQYDIYHYLLEETAPDRKLYMAQCHFLKVYQAASLALRTARGSCIRGKGLGRCLTTLGSCRFGL